MQITLSNIIVIDKILLSCYSKVKVYLNFRVIEQTKLNLCILSEK